MSKSKKKENFNQAMFEMFGIGKDMSAEEPASNYTEASPYVEDYTAEQPVAEQPVAEQPVYEEPVVQPVEPVVEPPRKSAQCTFLAEGTSIEGIMRCNSDVEIFGDFKGELVASGRAVIHGSTTSNVQASDLSLINCVLNGDANVSGCVSIDSNSSVNGNISGNDVICSGMVRGNLILNGNLTLNEKAQIYGDIKTSSLVIARGAKVTGKIEMGE